MSQSSINDKAVVRGPELRLQAARDGVTAAFPPGVQTIVVLGKAYTQAELQAKIDEELKPWKEVREAHAVSRQFTQDKPGYTHSADDLLTGLEAAAVAHYGPHSEELTKFGFKPAKRRRQLTVEEQVLKSAKAKITREKRGTLGKKQKAEIKAEGTPSVSVTPDAEMHITEAQKPAQPGNGNGH